MSAIFGSGAATAIRINLDLRTGAGPISVPGLQVGDAIVCIRPYGFDNTIEQIISVTDQLQQTQDMDLHGVSIVVFLMRGA